MHLTENEFVEVCEHVHALRDHSLRVRNSILELPENHHATREERIKIIGKWLYRNKSQNGYSILETINYVLYGGSLDRVPERIWDAVHSPEWMISHFGISTIGEIAGWALPDKYPPRNGRTSKALKALGYNVQVYSE